MGQRSAADETLEFLDVTAFNTEELRAELAALEEQSEGLIARMNTLISAGARTALDLDQYDADYEFLETKYQTVDDRHAQVAASIKDRENHIRQAHQVHDCVQTRPPLAYAPQAWNTLVAEAKVDSGGKINVRFKDEVDG